MLALTLSYLGAMSDPCCTKAPQLCQKQLCSVIILCGPGFRIYPLFRGKSENDFSKIEIFFKKVLVATTPLKRLESDILPSYDYLDVLLRSYLGPTKVLLNCQEGGDRDD